MFMNWSMMPGLIGLGFSGLLALGTVPLSPRPGVLKANFFRINNGMTVKDVEAVFGEPAGCTNEFSFFREHRQWSDNDGYGTVCFFAGRVVGKRWYDVPIWDKLEYRLVHFFY